MHSLSLSLILSLDPHALSSPKSQRKPNPSTFDLWPAQLQINVGHGGDSIGLTPYAAVLRMEGDGARGGGGQQGSSTPAMDVALG